MKALIVLEDKEKLSLLKKKLTNAGFDTICYQWLMKALDNLEEISPHLVIISAEDYPRHWKVFVQHVKANFSDNQTEIYLLASSKDSVESDKVKILGIKDVIYDFESDLQKLISSWIPDPEEIAVQVPSPEPDHTSAQVPSPEPDHTAAQVTSPEPAHTAAQVPTPEPAVTAAQVPTPEPAESAAQVASPEPAVTAAQVPTPEPADIAAQVTSPEPAHTAVQVASPEPADTAAQVATPEPADTAVQVASPEPADTAVQVSSPEPADTAAQVATPEPAHTAVQVATPEPAESAAQVSSPEPAVTAVHSQKPVVSSCNFIITNPVTNRAIPGRVRKYKYPTIIFIPNNKEDVKTLRFGQVFENCILKQVVNNKELSCNHRCQIRGFTDDSIEFCLLR